MRFGFELSSDISLVLPLRVWRNARSVDADYGDLLLQKDDPHPIKRHLSLYARRRLRRAISIAKRPVPLLRRKFAARTSLTSDLDMQVRPSDGYAVLPENF